MRALVIFVRSLLFCVLFYANLSGHLILALPTLVLPYPALRAFIRSYALTSLWLLRTVCGTGVAWHGVERIPDGPCIIACKHQSTWETFSLYAVLYDPVYVLKRELMWLPFFGWYARKAGVISVDRAAGMAALTGMTRQARRVLAAVPARPIVIFPEGTRRAPGAQPSYKPGVAHLYRTAGVPCVPVALNSGLYWPRRTLRRLPGTITVEILEPIPPGLGREEFSARLEAAIETASTSLLTPPKG